MDAFKNSADICVQQAPLDVKSLIKESKKLGSDRRAGLEYLLALVEQSSVTEGKNNAANLLRMEISDAEFMSKVEGKSWNQHSDFWLYFSLVATAAASAGAWYYFKHQKK